MRQEESPDQVATEILNKITRLRRTLQTLPEEDTSEGVLKNKKGMLEDILYGMEEFSKIAPTCKFISIDEDRFNKTKQKHEEDLKSTLKLLEDN